MIQVHRLPALTDNYMWLIVDEATGDAVVVDASEAGPVIEAVERLKVKLTAIWCTHHHHDHVGGNLELVKRFGTPVVTGSAYDHAQGRIPGQTAGVVGGDRLPMSARVIEIPGHTLGHVAYVLGNRVFCGDTLFGGGCGRLFEGTPAMMVESLGKLRDLPDDTTVHCGHEYTWHNVRFAVESGIEPDNAALRARHARVGADPGGRTVPTTLAEEKAANPFLRWDAAAVRKWTGKETDVEVFAEVRARKDRWRP